MRKPERVVLWLVVIALGIFAITINASVNSLEETVSTNVSRLEEPVIQASLFPVIPDEFTEKLAKAAPAEQLTNKNDYLWFVVRLTNAGNVDTRITAVSLALVPKIEAIYGLTNDGKNFKASWGGPTISEGGKGQNAVTAEFPVVPPGESHLIFVAVRPQGPHAAPYTPEARRWWVDNYPMYWQKMTVTAAQGGFSDVKKTAVYYGLALSGQDVG
jgi:hypothetical protein